MRRKKLKKKVLKRKPKKVKIVRVEKKKESRVFPVQVFHKTKIKVVGIGGGGNSILSEIASKVKKAHFVAANTDRQALKEVSRKAAKFHFGEELTGGLGAGMDPRLGEQAALNVKEKIKKIFEGQDLCILVSCLGGGTGSGASPIFAKISRDLGRVSLGIFTLPFKFEGEKKAEIAKNALEKIKPYLNAYLIIPNEKIFQVVKKETPLKEALSKINQTLAKTLENLINLIYNPGLINIDFADLKTILEGRGKLAYLQVAEAEGEKRAEEALKNLLQSPIYDYSIGGAERILFSISGGADLSMREVWQISKGISDHNKRAKIIFGITPDNSLSPKIKITLLAIGCQKEKKKKIKKIIKKEPPPPPPKIKKKKRKIKKQKKENSQKEEQQVKEIPRKNALEIKKEVQQEEEKMLAREKEWEIPAFLRRKMEKEQ